MTTAPAITMTGGNDWLAAAADHRIRYPRSDFGRHELTQLDRTLAYLRDRLDSGEDPKVTAYHAAAILLAARDAPPGELRLGIRDADAPVPELPADARQLLEGLGADVPVPTVKPTAVTAPKAKSRAKAKAAEGAEA